MPVRTSPSVSVKKKILVSLPRRAAATYTTPVPSSAHPTLPTAPAAHCNIRALCVGGVGGEGGGGDGPWTT